jgi:predicted nucleic acid-binding protein
VTVLDTSAVIDYLLGDGVVDQVHQILVDEGAVAAPDLLVFEVMAVLRRDVLRGDLDPGRADGALDDLGDLPIEVYPSMALRTRAWELRDNLTAADALFVALAEQLDERLVTKDAGLVAAAREQTQVAAVHISG